MKNKKVITTPKYWDCECEHNYIHPKSQLSCEKCGYSQDEMPDSRVNEVRRMILNNVREKIHDYEYLVNGMQHLNNSGVSVRNLKRVKGGYKADILLFIEDAQERYNDCEYPDGEEWEKSK
jgi:hypothetical protein